jgi:hypothetical protein
VFVDLRHDPCVPPCEDVRHPHRRRGRRQARPATHPRGARRRSPTSPRPTRVLTTGSARERAPSTRLAAPPGIVRSPRNGGMLLRLAEQATICSGQGSRQQPAD